MKNFSFLDSRPCPRLSSRGSSPGYGRVLVDLWVHFFTLSRGFFSRIKSVFSWTETRSTFLSGVGRRKRRSRTTSFLFFLLLLSRLGVSRSTLSSYYGRNDSFFILKIGLRRLFPLAGMVDLGMVGLYLDPSSLLSPHPSPRNLPRQGG